MIVTDNDGSSFSIVGEEFGAGFMNSTKGHGQDKGGGYSLGNGSEQGGGFYFLTILINR